MKRLVSIMIMALLIGQVRSQEYSADRQEYLLVCAPGAFTIDGVANEPAWAEAYEGFVNFNLGGSGVLNPADLDYSFKAMFSKTMFYFFIDVTDDEPTQTYPDTNPGESWMWESIELFFLLKPNVEFPGSDKLQEHFQIRLSPLYNSDDSIAQGHYLDTLLASKFGGTIARDMLYEHMKWAFKETLSGWSLELAFPWDMMKNIKPDFSLPINAGDFIGFDVEVRDYDNTSNTATPAGRYSWNRELASGTPSWGTYNHLGKLIFDEVCESVSVKNYTQCRFGIYPNPANGVIHIKNAVELLGADIVDVTGKRVMNVSKEQMLNGINISTLNAGVYFIRLKSYSNLIETSKIIVE
jgi:hypothetical protein